MSSASPASWAYYCPLSARVDGMHSLCRCICVRKMRGVREWKSLRGVLEPRVGGPMDIVMPTVQTSQTKVLLWTCATHHLCGYIGLHAAMQLHAQFCQKRRQCKCTAQVREGRVKKELGQVNDGSVAQTCCQNFILSLGRFQLFFQPSFVVTRFIKLNLQILQLI